MNNQKPKTKNQKAKGGYTLMEIIIYITIFAALSAAVINSYIVVIGTFSTTRTHRDLLESGNNALERISREVRQATDVDIINSTLGSTPGVLVLNTIDSSGSPRVVKFIVENGALNLYQASTFAGLTLTGNLLGQNVQVTNLFFRRINTANGEAIKIELTLTDIRSKNQTNANFYDTVILRGGY